MLRSSFRCQSRMQAATPTMSSSSRRARDLPESTLPEAKWRTGLLVQSCGSGSPLPLTCDAERLLCHACPCHASTGRALPASCELRAPGCGRLVPAASALRNPWTCLEEPEPWVYVGWWLRECRGGTASHRRSAASLARSTSADAGGASRCALQGASEPSPALASGRATGLVWGVGCQLPQ